MTALRRRVVRAAGAFHALVPTRSAAHGGEDAPIRRILVIRPDHLGDLLLTTPALQVLRAGFPDAEITLMVSPESAEVAQRQSTVDRVAEARFPGFERSDRLGKVGRYGALAALARRLRRERFDLAVIARPDFWWGAWLVAAAGIPRRLGYGLPDMLPFLTHPVEPAGRRHAAVDALHLAAAAARAWAHTQPDPEAWRPGSPALSFPVRPADRRAAAALLDEAGLTGRDEYVALHVGSGAAVKRWPIASWIALARCVRERLGCQVVLCGGSGDEADVRRAASAGFPAVSTPPTFGALGALLQRAIAVVGADSGAMHLAVALGRPTVTLFGPADPAVYGPWGPMSRHRVVTSGMVCSPCDVLQWRPEELRFHPCVRRIAPDLVLALVGQVLREDDRGRAAAAPHSDEETTDE